MGGGAREGRRLDHHLIERNWTCFQPVLCRWFGFWGQDSTVRITTMRWQEQHCTESILTWRFASSRAQRYPRHWNGKKKTPWRHDNTRSQALRWWNTAAGRRGDGLRRSARGVLPQSLPRFCPCHSRLSLTSGVFPLAGSLKHADTVSWWNIRGYKTYVLLSSYYKTPFGNLSWWNFLNFLEFSESLYY